MQQYPTYEECYNALPEQVKSKIEYLNYEKYLNNEYIPLSVYGVYDMHNVELPDNATFFNQVVEHAKNVCFHLDVKYGISEIWKDFISYTHTSVQNKRIAHRTGMTFTSVTSVLNPKIEE